jgi:hypothetical protein
MACDGRHGLVAGELGVAAGHVHPRHGLIACTLHRIHRCVIRIDTPRTRARQKNPDSKGCREERGDYR